MKKILWVEDEKFIFDQAAKAILIKAPQHDIQRVDNGKDASDHLMITRYDLLVVDLRINWKPGLKNDSEFNGIEILKLALTGRANIGDKEISTENTLDKEQVWVLTGYEEKKLDAIKIGVLPNQYILKGSERKAKFTERILEFLSNEQYSTHNK